jgi:hypothetical protein
MPRPPPTSRWCDADAVGLDRLHQIEQAVQRVQIGCDLVICDPMWQSMPATQMPGRLAARRYTAAPRRGRCRTCCPSGRWRCRGGSGVDVGVDAQADRRVLPMALATADSVSSSASLSTLKQRTPACSAARISSARLPTPEKTTRAGSPPAAITRASSPPRRCRSRSRPAKVCSTARLRVGLHRVAQQVRRGRPAHAGRRRRPRAWRCANRRTAACRTRRARSDRRTPSSHRSAPRRARCGAPGRDSWVMRRVGAEAAPAEVWAG